MARRRKTRAKRTWNKKKVGVFTWPVELLKRSKRENDDSALRNKRELKIFSTIERFVLMRMWHYFYTDLEDEGEEGEDLDGEIIHADDDPIQSNYPTDCCPENCYKKFPFLAGDDDAPFWQGWANLRLKTFQLIENKYFETAVITMILLSSLALVREHAWFC